MSRAGCGFAFFLLVGCLAGCHRQSRVELGARDQVLLLGNGAEPKDLDPGVQVAEIEYIIDTALFEGLVNIANDGQTILPGVAERWDVSADGRAYTFHLRPGERWSDGAPLTADDFVYSFRRVFTPSILCENNVYGYAITGAREMNQGKGDALGVRAIDAHTLEVRLDFRAPYILYILAGAPFDPVPRSVVERFGGGVRPGTAWSRPGNLVGNGPFVLKSWRQNQEVVAAKNPDYWDAARVRLNEIHFFPTDNLDAEERAFRAGELHVTYSLPNSKLQAYRDRGDSRLHVSPQLSTSYIIFNVKAHPFGDVRVRKAFALALDREHLIPEVFHGAASPAHSLTRPGTDEYTPPAVADFDPDQAKKLLAQAGFPQGAGFPSVTFQCAQGPDRPLVEAMQESWRQVLGVRVELSFQEQKSYFDQLRSRGYAFGFMGFFYGVNAPETILMVAQGESLWNYTDWKSPEFDRAYLDANHAANETERRAAFDRMERLLSEGAAFSPVYFRNQPFLLSPLVRGWRDNSLDAIDWRELSLVP